MVVRSNPELPELPPPRRRGWVKGLAIAGGVLALGGVILGGWGYTVVRRELPEFLEDNLSTALGRPLKVGEFQRFGPTGVRLGPSIVPPTEDDFSWVKAKALEVNFNPLELLFTRTLRPSLVFVEPQMAIKQGFDGEWRLQVPQSAGRRGLIQTRLRSIQIRNANLAIGPISRTSIVELPEGVTSATLILLENVNLRVRFSGPDNQTAHLVVGGRLNNGAFQLRGEGQLDTRQANLAVQAQQVPIEAVNPLFSGDFFVRGGLLSSNLDLTLRPEAADPLTVKGTARLRNGDIVIAGLPSPIQEINGTFVANGVGGRFEHSSLKFGPILARAEGRVDLHQGYNLLVTLPNFSVQDLETALDRTLPLEAEGRFRLKTHLTGPLLEPQVAGSLDSLSVTRVDRVALDRINAQFTANLEAFTLDQATLRPTTGGTLTAQGIAKFDPQNWWQPDLSLTAQTDLPLDGLAQVYEVPLPGTLRLGPLVAQAQVTGRPEDLRALADWQLPQATFPGRGRVTYANGLIQAPQAVFQVGEGTLRANGQARVDTLNWQANVAGSALALGLLSPQLRGTLDTNLQASGSLRALNPQGLRAEGQIRLSDTIPLALNGAEQILPGPLKARFVWTGRRLEVPEATAPGLAVRGGADVTFSGGLPDITGMDFAARLSKVDLGAAYALLDGPGWLRPRGYLEFDGTLRGRLRDPQLAGQLGLRQLAINDLALFEGVAGPMRASLSQGLQVDLRGGDDQLAAIIDPSLRPDRFRVTNGEFVATGYRQGEILEADLRGFDIGDLALRPLERPDLGRVDGLLNAQASIDLENLRDPAIAARFAIDQPALGAIAAQSLTGQLHYRQGQALLTNGNLHLTPQTQFLVTGSGRLFPTWQARAEIATHQADFQDILHVLRLYSYEDLGHLLNPPALGLASDLPVHGVGLPEAPLLEQATLARALKDLGQMVDQQQANALLPSLDQLEGQISGTLGLAASRQDGLAADFNFTGQNWVWGRYNFGNQFLAQGRLRDQTLTLDPVEFRAGETRLSLIGDLSPQDSDLTAQVAGLPLTAAATLLETPFEVSGLLNLEAQLTGPYTNPQLVGGLAVDQATINQQPLQVISSRFQYQDAVFFVDGQIVGSAPEPLLFSGTVPYALPFMTVQPASHELALRASLKNEALSLMNLFTPWVVWGGGEANVDVQVGGTLNQPLVFGAIAFNQATFNSPLLNASLTNLDGEIQLQGTRIQTDSLTGTLFDGTFELTGGLPLTAQGQRLADPGLQLALNDIQFQFFDEVRSDVNGTLAVTHALLSPTLGGDIRLQNTRVAVGPRLIKLVNAVLVNPGLASLRATLAEARQFVPLQLDDLRVTLEPATLKAPPLFSLDVQGQLAISGPVPGLYADGQIDLIDGWLNTVTAEFVLEQGHDNRVVFSPANQLDPYLDLILTARVPLQRNYNINRVGTTTGAAEIPDIDPLGSNTVFDELLIEARVKGPASRLFENLQLTSNPPYSQNQLLSMVSGGYLADLGGAEPTLALGANLLTAFTADTQDSIGQALGLRWFRLTASTIQPTETGDALGYGVGANLGITENLSASLVQVLNQDQPFQLNARYRLNENWGIGGSTSFDDESRFFLEYRIGF